MGLLIVRVAEDQKRGMTLDELATFVAEAYAAQTPGTAHLDITFSFRGKLQKITTI